MTNRAKEHVLERIPSAENDLEIMTKVLAQIFVLPNKYAAVLNAQGIPVGSTEPLGITDISLLQMLIELDGVPRDEGGRRLATKISKELIYGDTFDVVPNSQGRIQSYRDDKRKFYYRGDLGVQPEILRQRYDAYVAILDAEIKARRTRTLQPPTVYTPTGRMPIHVITDYGNEYVNTELINLKEQGMHPVALNWHFSQNLVPTRVFHPETINTLLVRGTSESFLRDRVLQAAKSQNSAHVASYASFANEESPRIIKAAKEFKPKSVRDVHYLVTPAPLSRLFIDIFHEQGESDQQLPTVSASEPRGLPLGYPLWLVCRILEGTPIDDSSYYFALLSEMIGSIYHNPYSKNGHEQQVGLEYLRQLANDFSLIEARQIWREIARNRNPKDRLNVALLNHIPRLQPNPIDYTQGEKSKGYKDAVERSKSINDHTRKKPNPDDYRDGERSAAFIRDSLLFDSAEATRP